MPDPRSVMKEFRFLDQKRAVEGLSPDEATRYDALRDLVGPETISAGARPGFDVGAAAARLRESLLPAGLRNRPPPTPEPSPEPLGEIEPPAGAPSALVAEYEAQPFQPIEPNQADAGLFDPVSLGSDTSLQLDSNAPAYDPNAALYDPNAAAYDPNAALYDPNAPAYDPNAPAYDPNAPAYDPNAPAYDPNAALYDPNAPAYDPNAAAYDPNAPAYDPNAPAYDPNAPAYDPNAPPYDPNAPAYDPNAPAYDPNAAAYDPNAPAYDPNAPAYDPNAPAYDPNAPPYDPNAAAYDPNAPAYDPNAFALAPNAAIQSPDNETAGPLTEAETAPSFETADAGLPDVPTSPEDDWSGVTAEVEGGAEPVLEQQLGSPEAAPVEASESLFDSEDVLEPLPGEGQEPAWAPVPGGEYDAAAWDARAGESAAPEPPLEPAAGAEAMPAQALANDLAPYPPQGWSGEPTASPKPATAELGSYDEVPPTPADDLEGLLPFDAASEAVVNSGTLRAFGGAGAERSEEFDAGAGPGDLTEREGFHAAPSLVEEEAPGWQAEPMAVEQGFQQESGGSFDARADAAAPEWAAPTRQQPMAWEAAPTEGGDLAAPDPHAASPEPDAAAKAQLDFSSPELTASEDVSDADLTWEQPAPQTQPPIDLEPLDVASLDLDMEPEPLNLAAASEEAGDRLQDVDVTFLAGALESASEELPTLDEADLVEELPSHQTTAVPEPLDLEGFSALPYPAAGPEDHPPDESFVASESEPAPQAQPGAGGETHAPEDAYAATELTPAEPEPVEAPAPGSPNAPALPEPEAQAATPSEPLAPPTEATVIPPFHSEPSAAPAEDQPLEVIDAALELEPEVTEVSSPAAEDHVVRGLHRVVVHTLEGQVKRGFLQDADLAAAALPLAQTPGAAPEELAVEHVKAIFFMLAPGEQPPPPRGNRVRVVFRDGRQVAGYSPDYHEGAFGFFMIPADTRTTTSRIWVFQAAVRQVAVS